jgi:hypothetical protein
MNMNMNMRKTEGLVMEGYGTVETWTRLLTYTKGAVELNHAWLGRRHEVTLLLCILLYSAGFGIAPVKILGAVAGR